MRNARGGDPSAFPPLCIEIVEFELAETGTVLEATV